MTSVNSQHIEALLEQTMTRPKRSPRKPTRQPSVFKKWASSQVAAYRLGLVLGYAFMVNYGFNAFVAGVPVFVFTTPEGWTPIWAVLVMVGGFVAGVGAVRAGAEPITKEVRVFNWIELSGATLLFLTLGTYAAILLILGYGFHDSSRVSVGSGFLALGIGPAVRMIWLTFRPRMVRKTDTSEAAPDLPGAPTDVV